MPEIKYEEISFVVQGIIYEDYTREVCKSIRKYAPGAEIIVSTWKGCSVDELDYDVLVENDDPGNFIFVLPEIMDNGTRLYPMNVNRQIVSTINGLKKSTRKYACKLRSDLIITGTQFVEYYEKYNLPIKEPYNRLITHRVVTLTSVNPRRYHPFAYYLCDWFFFGKLEDVMQIWDIPLVSTDNLKKNIFDGKYYMRDNFGNEQYIWMAFLRKCQRIYLRNGYELSDDILQDSERSYANCCIFATAKDANVYSLKVGKTGYGDKSCLSNAGLYTENDWIRMYNRFCDGNEKEKKEIGEEIVFQLARLLRKIKGTRFACFYYFIKNMRRK